MSNLNRRIWLSALVMLLLQPATVLQATQATAAGSSANIEDTQAGCLPLLNHPIRRLMSPVEESLCHEHSGKVLLIVNTASRCGFTPQFEGLEALHKQYSEQGFAVLGFPSDDFRQELASETEVAEFCQLNYGVTFPMYQKVHVSPGKAHPLFQALADQTGKFPAWNFNKYLIDRQGQVINQYGSSTAPLDEQLVSTIKALL